MAAPSVAFEEPPPRSVLPELEIWRQLQRIGGNLTPVRVSSIIRQADVGQMAPLVDLGNELRQKDGHMQSVLGTRENALSGLKWELVLPNKKRGGKRQIKFVREVLSELSDLYRLFAHLSGGPFYGYSVSEILWKLDRGKIVPASFKNHSARRFGFRLSDGAFVWRDEGMPEAGVDIFSAYPGRFIVSQPRINGDVPCREGLIRVLVWLALFRNWTMSDWLKLGEIAWKPLREGVYSKDASKEDREALRDILQYFTADGIAVHSDRTEIKVHYPSGAQSTKATHSELFDTSGREMSKAVLGQTLTVEQGRVGSQALGQVHNEVRKDVLEADALHIAYVINRYLIRPLILMNFGPTAPVPVFVFVTDDAADLVQFATAIEKFCGPNVRLPIPARWVRDECGIPEPKEGEPVLGPDHELPAAAE